MLFFKRKNHFTFVFREHLITQMTDWEVYKSNVDDMEIDTEEEDMSLYFNQEDDKYNDNYYQRQSFSYTPERKYLKSIGSPNNESATSDNEEHINHEFLENGKFDEEKYWAFKEKAIEERANLGAGKSHLMNMLFCFWCFYLRDHFENDMYIEFLTYAREDRSLGANYGIQCFYRFCSYGLETNWLPEVYETFEDEAMSDYWKGNKYGLEKFKAFHINQKYDFQIPIKPETKRELDKYPTCRSFREPINNYNNNKNVQRRGSDASRVTFKFGSMPQPKYKPPISNNNNQQPPTPPPQQQQQQQQQKKKNKRKNKNKNKFNYTPDQDNSANLNEKEKEEMEKKKELEKQMANTQTEVKSLPGKYVPPSMTSENKDLFKAPPQAYKPKYQNHSPKNSAPREWTFGKAQPQSLPKNSSFRRNKW